MAMNIFAKKIFIPQISILTNFCRFCSNIYAEAIAMKEECINPSLRYSFMRDACCNPIIFEHGNVRSENFD